MAERWFSPMCDSAIFSLSHPLGPVHLCIQLADVGGEPEEDAALLKHLNLKVTHVISLHRPKSKLVKGFCLDNRQPGKQNPCLGNCFAETAPCYRKSVDSYNHLCQRCPQWAQHCLSESEAVTEVLAHILRLD